MQHGEELSWLMQMSFIWSCRYWMQLNQLSATNVLYYIDMGGNSFIVAFSSNVKQKGQQKNNDHVM